MTSHGLEGIWLFEQLDRSQMPTWKLAMLLIGGCLTIGVIAAYLAGPADSEAMAAFWTSEITSLIFLLFFSVLGLSVAANLSLARAIEDDMRQIQKIDGSISDSYKLLKPRSSIFWSSILLVNLVLLLVLPSGTAGRLDVSLFDALHAYFTSGTTLTLLIVFIQPLVATSLGIGAAITATQISFLTKVARRIRIDWVSLNRYSVIANPGVRMTIATFLGTSLIPLSAIYIDDPFYSDNSMNLILFILLLVSPTILWAFYPTFLLRSRIRNKKQDELNAIEECMLGSEQAVQKLSIAGRGTPISTAEFLTLQMFIETRWEWPVAAHLQKLVFFGLLPPLGWTLAAVIENLLY